VTLAQAGDGKGAPVKVQTGGGIRTEDDVAAVLDLGVTRVVLGTAALEDPALATRCARRWPGQIAVGLDYVQRPDGVVEARSHGWEQGSGRPLSELLEMWAGEPIGAVVATAIVRDGMLGGADLDGLGTLLAGTALPVIASGGVGSLDDLRALARVSEPGSAGASRTLAGVIVGKALVEGRFELEEAMAACAVSV
jgi:phosphoribosylformimino-5-aminoimidazole carboxamide ribotide isomerase